MHTLNINDKMVIGKDKRCTVGTYMQSLLSQIEEVTVTCKGFVFVQPVCYSLLFMVLCL